MKPFLIKCLRVFCWIALAILVVLLVAGAVYGLDWPWWAGIFILTGLAGLAMGILFLRKLMRRKHEQLFVQEMVQQDESYLRGVEAIEREQLQDLQDRWKEALETLRGSHLKKLGNPLYVLPWYLVIGESGSGKTTALTSAKLSSPFAQVSRTSGISGTRNCDWWFFEQAIIIDTAGRYAIPVDEGRDKEEWQKFMGLLVKYRKREPLNGLIVTVAADKLAQAGAESLDSDGRDIRRRLDELMRVLGARIPVYVLVTKCDLVQGLSRFCDRLPEKCLEQPMGCVNQDLSHDCSGFTDRVFESILSHLRDFRLLILHQSQPQPQAQAQAQAQSQGRSTDPALIVFPEEFEKLKPGLQAFVKAAFQENPYQETPALRGIYFSSGRQEGTPYSHFLQALGLIEERDVLPGTSRGLFLHDFFAKVLPRDRYLFAPTQKFVEWQRVSRNLGLTSWIALGIALCGLLSLSFVKNLQTLREVSHEFLKPPVLTGDFLADVSTMDRFRLVILNVEEENRNWWIPRFGLRESLEAEQELKKRYCEQFRKGFLAGFDRELEVRIGAFSGATPDLVVALFVEHLARRINLMKARLEGKELEELRKKPQPSYELMLGDTVRSIRSDAQNEFGELFLYYLIWRSSTVELGQEASVLQTWLKRIMTMRDKDLRWLATWVNAQEGLSDVVLESFWQGSGSIGGKIAVQRAFTKDGRVRLDGFIAEINEALPDPVAVAPRFQDFEKWYHDSYLTAWHDFAVNFSKGAGLLKGRKEWQQAAGKMASDQGPYFMLLARMPLELAAIMGAEKLPTWVWNSWRWEMVKAKTGLDGAADEKGLLARAAQAGKDLMARGSQQAGSLLVKQVQIKKECVDAYQEYVKALDQITPAAASRKVAYDLAAQAFAADPASGKALFHDAYKAVSEYRTSTGMEKGADEAVLKLIRGPADFLWTFVCREAACVLQKEWEEKVLMEVQGVTDRTSQEMLLGQDGLAWKYARGTAAPFIERSLKSGYFAKEVLGAKIPIDAEFFSFLSQGVVARNVIMEVKAQSQHSVNIEALPTGANPDSPIKPKATHLRMECQSGTQVLDNYNYPMAKVFNWSPEGCSDVTLQIDVEDITLVRKYSGEDAFPKFLKEFQGGQRIMRSGEFPMQKAALEALGVKYVDVRYRFKGHGAITGLQKQAAPRKVPREIVKCWD